MSIDPATKNAQLRPHQINNSTSQSTLTISSLINNNAIEVEGMIEGVGKLVFLVYGVAHVNAIVPKLVTLLPNRNKLFLHK